MELNLLHRKDSVILTAIEIIDELGIQGLSTREIAKRQGISEGTLFRHFKTKNEIIAAVFDHFSQYDEDIFNTAKLKAQSAREAILFTIESYVNFYENYPPITSIMQLYGVLVYQSDVEDKVRSIIDTRLKFIEEIIASGQDTGEFAKSTDKTVLADIIIGTFGNICGRWRMSGCSFSLRDHMMAAIKFLLDSASTK